MHTEYFTTRFMKDYIWHNMLIFYSMSRDFEPHQNISGSISAPGKVELYGPTEITSRVEQLFLQHPWTVEWETINSDLAPFGKYSYSNFIFFCFKYDVFNGSIVHIPDGHKYLCIVYLDNEQLDSRVQGILNPADQIETLLHMAFANRNYGKNFTEMTSVLPEDTTTPMRIFDPLHVHIPDPHSEMLREGKSPTHLISL